MADALMFETQKRTTRGSQAARQMRRKGLIPAIVYGHKEEAASVTLPRAEVEKAIRHGVRVVDLKSGGDLQKALIRDVQWDHLGKELLHIDFERVAADERVNVAIRIELRGTAPGIKEGGVLEQPIHTLMVECPVISVPESIRVNVGEMHIGSVIHVKDLKLPPDVTTAIDPEAVVVQLVQKQVELEAGAAPAVPGGPAEPEIIGRKAAEEEEAE